LPFGSADAGDIVRPALAAVTENYGHAMPLFVLWMLMRREEWDTWRAGYREEVYLWSALARNNVASRLAAYLAAITFTAKLVHRAFAEAGHPLPWDFSPELLRDEWNRMAAETDDAPVEVRALQDVMA
jgi:hypothetical protein